jgi:hypothetical protein
MQPEEKEPMKFGLTPKTWRMIGYVRDALIILGIALGAWHLSEHPEKFDAFILDYRLPVPALVGA